MPSPILPCGCLCAIPIPYNKGGIPYSEIWFGDCTLQQICSELNSNWKGGPAHLDPDLRYDSLRQRPFGWRPAFGQSGASATHLNNQGVDEGDLFVFFGWFRKTELSDDGTLRFCSSDKHGRHVIFGWMQVGSVVKVGEGRFERDLEFLNEHAHVQFVKDRRNQIYIGSESELGSGLFSSEREELVLTRPNCNRSEWRLPSAFESVCRGEDMTHHNLKPPKSSRWALKDGQISLTAASRGQEFVIDGAKHSAVVDHFSSLIKSAPEASTPCAHDHPSPRRQLGSAKGEFTVTDDFDSADAEIEKLFYEGDHSSEDPLD